MSKNFFQDMVRMKNERRGIPPPSASPTLPPTSKIPPPISHLSPPNTRDPIDELIERERHASAGKSKRAMWLVAAIAVIFLVFALSFLFSGAEIVVEPKVENFALNQSFSGVLNAPTDNTTQTLSFDSVVLSGEEMKEVAGGEEREASIAATGTAMLYNAFSSKAQNLDIDTRLEGSNGKLYKTKTKTTVPGMKTDGTPGSVEVAIYAAEPGESFNATTGLDFKIFGFKNTPKYAKFYGRSKGAISGGFQGTTRAVSEGDKEVAYNELKTILEAKLVRKVKDQIPPGFILFPGAASFVVDSQSVGKTENSSSASGMVPLTVKGTLRGVLFEEAKLTSEILNKLSFSNVNNENEELYIPNLQSLNFDLLSNTGQKVDFKLSGDLKVVSKIDEAKLKQDVMGEKKKNFNTVLASYPNISSANLTLRPFWKRSLPQEEDQIEVIVNYPE